MSTFSVDTLHLDHLHPKYKKYSLRDRHQKHQMAKMDREKTFSPFNLQANNSDFSRESADKIDMKQEASLLASTFVDNSTFNLPQTPSTDLEFNRVGSVKLIKTQKSIEQPIISASMLKIPSNSTLLHKLEDNHTRKSSNISNHFESFIKNPQPSQHIQRGGFEIEHSVVSQKSMEDTILPPWRPNKQKFSLRRSNPLSNPRSQLRVCLQYTDIRFPLRSLKSQQLREMYQSRKNLQMREGQNRFARFLCNQLIRFGKYGCNCEPKCLWINRWLNRAQFQEIRNHQNIFVPASQWEATMAQVDKDVPRTQVNNQTFFQEDYRIRLREVLLGYCRLDWQVGYVQGMNMVASVIVYHSTGSYEALKVFQLLMRQMDLRSVYLGDLCFGIKVATRLMRELERLAFDLYSHFQAQGVDVKMFATSWYLSLLGAFVPVEWMHCIIQKFMRRGWSGINEVIIALLLLFREQLLLRDTIEIMQLLSCKEMQLRAGHLDWSELIARSDNILLPPFQS